MRIEAYFQLSGEKITKTKTRLFSREAQRNSQGPCRVNHEKHTSPALLRCRYWTAAIFNENQILLVSKTFGTKKSFENFSDARVSACARSMFSTVIGSYIAVLGQTSSFPFVCALSSYFVFALASIGFLRKCVIPHLAVFGQIPSYRARLSAFGQILLCSRAMMCCFVKYRIPQLKDDVAFFRSQKLAKRARKLEAYKYFNS